jgi:RHS repeat-associated protein
MPLAAGLDRYPSLAAMCKALHAADFAAQHLAVSDPSVVPALLQNRYYSPMQGQFISQDPLFLAIGSPTQLQKLTQQAQRQLLMNPQQLNSYSYGEDNPVTLKDPLGLEAQIFSGNPVVAGLEYFGYLSELKDVYDYAQATGYTNPSSNNGNVSNSSQVFFCQTSSSRQKRVHSQTVGAIRLAASGRVSEKKSATSVGPVVGSRRRLPLTVRPLLSV